MDRRHHPDPLHQPLIHPTASSTSGVWNSACVRTREHVRRGGEGTSGGGAARSCKEAIACGLSSASFSSNRTATSSGSPSSASTLRTCCTTPGGALPSNFSMVDMSTSVSAAVGAVGAPGGGGGDGGGEAGGELSRGRSSEGRTFARSVSSSSLLSLPEANAGRQSSSSHGWAGAAGSLRTWKLTRRGVAATADVVAKR